MEVVQQVESKTNSLNDQLVPHFIMKCLVQNDLFGSPTVPYESSTHTFLSAEMSHIRTFTLLWHFFDSTKNFIHCSKGAISRPALFTYHWVNARIAKVV